MNGETCQHEAAVVTALGRGEMSDELRAHVDGCPVCAEVALVAGVLRRTAASDAETPLPDPGAIWRRAELARRDEAARRAVLPIIALQRLSALLAVALTGFFAVWLWPQARGWLGSVPLPALPSPAGMAEPAVITMAGMGLVLLVVASELYRAWAVR